VGFYRRYRDVFLVILLLAVPFFFLRASIRNPEDLNVIDRSLMRVMAPVQFLAAASARRLSESFSDYVYLVDVRRDNNRLSREVQRLRHDVRQLAQVQAENDRLRNLLGLKESLPVETVSAAITTKTPTEFFRVAQLAIDHGGARVLQNMPVIGPGGAVGLIRTVSGDSATVQLVADAGFGVDVVVPRTRARGFVRGVGDESKYTVKVEYVRRSDEVEVGDLLVTSGVGCRFPEGIAVAKVAQVVKRDFGSYQTVIAEPTVDFSRLDSVLIVVGAVPGDCPRLAQGARNP
jgi:rod shape-determining protein MreC